MANFSVIFRQTRHIEDGNDQLNYHFAEGMDCLQTYEVDAQSEEEAITKAKVELEAAGWDLEDWEWWGTDFTVEMPAEACPLINPDATMETMKSAASAALSLPDAAAADIACER